MFGCITAGRPVLTNFTPLSLTQYTLTLPYPPATLNHLVVFLLPETVLPQGTAATVYIHFPTSTSPTPSNPTSKQPEWKLLGAIANEKPSAIFRVRSTSNNSSSPSTTANSTVDADEMTDDAASSTATATSVTTAEATTEPVILGIGIEPLESVEVQLAALKEQQQSAASQPNALVSAKQTAFDLPPPQVITILARRIIKNCFNYLASFSEKGRNGQDMVPLRAFQEWWTKFEKRVELDPSFLEREE